MNLLVVVIDSLRSDHIGCYGNTWIRTPVMDRLAGGGVLFSQMYVGTSGRVPSRLEMLSGCWAWNNHHTTQEYASQPLLPQLLSGLGYITCWLSDNPAMFRADPPLHGGFDSFDFVRGFGHDPWARADLHCQCKGPDACSSPAGHHWLHNQRRRVAGGSAGDDDLFTLAGRWLQSPRAAEQPFLLWVESRGLNPPWDAPEAFNHYGAPARPAWSDIWPEEGSDVVETVDGDRLNCWRALYAARVEQIDHQVGQLLAYMPEHLRAQTAVVLVSDGGCAIGDHGHVGRPADDLHAVQVRQSLIMHIPGCDSGRRVDALAQSVDIGATLVELAGVDVDKASLQGRSLLGLLYSDTSSQFRSHCRICSEHAERISIRTVDSMAVFNGPSYVPVPTRDDVCCAHDLCNDAREQYSVAHRQGDLVDHLLEML